MAFSNNLQRDIELALSLLQKKEQDDTYKLYPWSNERIFRYYNYYNLENKKALCITGSGDHALYAISAGATEIDCADKNPLCKYYSALKNGLMQAYDEKTFLKQFNYNKRKNILATKINLEDIKPFINEEVYIFWNELFKSKAFKKNKNLFRTDGFPGVFSLDYEDVRKKLQNVTINYYDEDIKDFSDKKNKKYGAIYLSNLLDWEHYKERPDILSNCMDLLDENGVLYDVFINRNFSNEKPLKNLEQKIKTEYGTPDLYFSEKGVYVYRKK